MPLIAEQREQIRAARDKRARAATYLRRMIEDYRLKEEDRMAAAAEIAREQAQELWDGLLERTEAWVEKIGGWSLIGPRDVARVALHLDPQDGNVDRVTSELNLFLRRQKSSQIPPEQTLEMMSALALEFETSDDPRSRFFEILRDATGVGLTPLTPGKDWPFTIELIPVDSLFADETYQRPVDENFVRELVMKFDERLVGTIDVSKRKGRKTLAMMDGRQRHAACGAVGKTEVYCTVYTGLSLADEARFFHHKNRDRKIIHPYYHYNARLVAGEPDALEIDRIVARHGFKLAVGGTPVEAITAIRAVEQVFGYTTTVRSNALDPTLEKMQRMWWGVKGGKDGTIIRGMGRFFATYSDEQIQWRHLEDALAAMGPLILIGRAKDHAKRYAGAIGSSSMGVAITHTLVQIHNTGLPREKRLDPNQVFATSMSRAA